MSYRNRKVVQEAFVKNSQNMQARLLATEGLKDIVGKVLGGIFDSPEVKDKKKDEKKVRKMIEKGVTIDTKKKAEFIRMMNNTFLNDEWLSEQPLKTGELSFPKLRYLLTNGDVSGDLATTIINNYEEHCDLMRGYIVKTKERAEVVNKEWDKFIAVTLTSPNEHDENSPVVKEAIEAMGELVKKGKAATPVTYFKRPRRVLGCVEIRHDGKSFVNKELPCDETFQALDANGLKKLAEHVVDNFDVLWPISDELWATLGGIYIEMMPDDIDVDFWWGAIFDHNDSMDMYYQTFWDDVPDKLDHYENSRGGWIYNLYPETIVKLLIMHLE